MTAFEVLCKILDKKTILASDSSGYIRQGQKAVCFQDIPLYSLAESIKYENACLTENGNDTSNTKCHYEAFGLRFNKGAMFQKGARPVIYGTKSELDRFPSTEQWLCVQFDLGDSKKIVDWTHEREWRIQGDFRFEYDEIEVIVGCKKYYKKFIEHYSGSALLSQINGIIVLDSMFR